MFYHYYYYGHVLPITINNPEETYCYARPASVIINSDNVLKCWAAEAKYHQTTIMLSSPRTPIYRLVHEYWVFSIEGRAKQNVSIPLLLPVITKYVQPYPDSKVRGANMGPTWVLSAPGGPFVGPMNFAIRDMVNPR